VKRYAGYGIAFGAAAVAAIGLVLHAARAAVPAVDVYVQVGRAPAIRPDYAGVTIPPGIAPLNFCVEEPGRRYLVRVGRAGRRGWEVAARTQSVVIPEAGWREFLATAQGAQIGFEVYAEDERGTWRRFEPFTVTVARDAADPYIVYRGMNVVYRWYTTMRLRQRHIGSFDEEDILDNRSFGGCMNCHTFLNNGADRMLIHVRSNPKQDYGSGMLLFEDGHVTKVDTRTRYNPGMAAFSSWHPSGRAIAYSISVVTQFFHSAGTEVREGAVLKSSLALYFPDSGEVTTTAVLCNPAKRQTWPAWSADGKHLYYCSAPRWWDDEDIERVPVEKKTGVRYDLMRIAYDLDTGEWGEPETVLSAEQTGLSIVQPRPSPDGRFLVFGMMDHGCLPAFDPESDLYRWDLATGEYHPMECNSERSESWHSWSSNGRWMVFASKREDGLFMRPYLAHIAEDGTAGKPFVLPQKDPTFYASDIHIYQMPEFVREPVPVRGEALGRIVRSNNWRRVDVLVTQASPAAAPQGE
jgi:hypothetical protein